MVRFKREPETRWAWLPGVEFGNIILIVLLILLLLGGFGFSRRRGRGV
jgi:hypothetical protein